MGRLEKLAEWYLTKKRGRAILSPTFMGFVVGNGVAIQDTNHKEIWTLTFLTPYISIVAMNQATVIRNGKAENWEEDKHA
jgi:hypothetical protein